MWLLLGTDHGRTLRAVAGAQRSVRGGTKLRLSRSGWRRPTIYPPVADRREESGGLGTVCSNGDFRFQLTKEEYENVLRSSFLTSKEMVTKTSKRGGRQYLPYVFTEQGIYMLMSVLKGDLATVQSKTLIRTFKRMKDFVIQLENVLPSSAIQTLAIQTQHNTEDIRQIKQQVNDLPIVVKDFTDPIFISSIITSA